MRNTQELLTKLAEDVRREALEETAKRLIATYQFESQRREDQRRELSTAQSTRLLDKLKKIAEWQEYK